MENKQLEIIDTTNSEQYIWGENCIGWHFVKSASLSVIRESMPPMTQEKLHYHENAQQFFYILSGKATFEISGSRYHVNENKGILIAAEVRHRILNETDRLLEFLVISEPRSHADRIDL